MSLNGSGVFNVNSAGQPVVAGTLITAAAFNAYTADVAAALSTALYSDGQRVNAANQNMGGYKLTGLAAGASPGESVRYEQLLAWLLLSGGNMTGGINGKLSTVASHATTADIFATTIGSLIDWTGTATTTAFAAAPQAGAERTLVCAAAAAFTAGADMLIDGVPSGQTYTCAAGDKIIVRAVTTTQFRLTIQPYAATTSNTSMIRLSDQNGYGATATKVRRFLNVITNQGTDIVYADSAADGGSFTIITAGVYAVSYTDTITAGTDYIGVTVDAAPLTTNCVLLVSSMVLTGCDTPSAGNSGHCSATAYLPAGSVVRAMTAGSAGVAATNRHQFIIARVK